MRWLAIILLSASTVWAQITDDELSKISKEEIVGITRNLLNQICTYIVVDNKKNEVDELTENVAILYDRDLYDGVAYELIDGLSINETIVKLSKCKLKDYKSLTNKSIFKFMDLVDK